MKYLNIACVIVLAFCANISYGDIVLPDCLVKEWPRSTPLPKDTVIVENCLLFPVSLSLQLHNVKDGTTETLGSALVLGSKMQIPIRIGDQLPDTYVTIVLTFVRNGVSDRYEDRIYFGTETGTRMLSHRWFNLSPDIEIDSRGKYLNLMQPLPH